MAKSWSLEQLPSRYQEQAKAQLPERVGIPTAIKKRKARPEGELQDEIVERLQTLDFLVAHFRPAKVMRAGIEKYETPVGGDGAGWPDIVAVNPVTGQCLVLELKSETGTVSDAQLEWLKAWTAVQGVTAMVIRPSSWQDFERLL